MSEMMKCRGWKVVPLPDGSVIKVLCNSEKTIIMNTVERWEDVLHYRRCLDCGYQWVTGYKKQPESRPPKEETYICPS